MTGIKTEIEVSVDLSEASSLGHAQDNIHIYSNSWGPKDNGFTVEALGPLVTRTLESGAREVNNTCNVAMVIFHYVLCVKEIALVKLSCMSYSMWDLTHYTCII